MSDWRPTGNQLCRIAEWMGFLLRGITAKGPVTGPYYCVLEAQERDKEKAPLVLISQYGDTPVLFEPYRRLEQAASARVEHVLEQRAAAVIALQFALRPRQTDGSEAMRRALPKALGLVSLDSRNEKFHNPKPRENILNSRLNIIIVDGWPTLSSQSA